ncbi:MAG: type II toxin-antitoxin system RelE/ParE family toxin [Myxococcales bacterium]|nr:type II toxin-antitoxin system RelE/ParE family toxin [Myxococcales bacterium]
MRRCNLEVQPRAEQDIVRIDTWWRENRPGAPDLFYDEFERATEFLRSAPRIGRLDRATGLPGVRRYLIRATGHHIYYCFRDELDTVVILALWNAVSGHGPLL